MERILEKNMHYIPKGFRPSPYSDATAYIVFDGRCPREEVLINEGQTEEVRTPYSSD